MTKFLVGLFLAVGFSSYAQNKRTSDHAYADILVGKNKLTFQNDIAFQPSQTSLRLGSSQCEIKRPATSDVKNVLTLTAKSYSIMETSNCKFYKEDQNAAGQSVWSLCTRSYNAKKGDTCESVTEEQVKKNMDNVAQFFMKDSSGRMILEVRCEKELNFCSKTTSGGELTLRRAHLLFNGANNSLPKNADSSFLSMNERKEEVVKDEPSAAPADAKP